MTYKLGRVARDYRRWAPTMEDYLRRHPKRSTTGLEWVYGWDDVDRASKVTEWPMYKNDSIGDCTIAEMGHAFTALGVYAAKPEVLFSDDAIIQAYSAVSGYDPATGENDNGAQMQDVLAYCRKVGMTDVNGGVHKVVAYASLAVPTDIQTLSQVLKTFGYAYIGINCPQAAEDDFGQVWDYVPGSPIIGGHCIGLHRRMAYGSRRGVFQMATWGALQPTTIKFINHYVDEAWAVITDDWIEQNGDSCDGVALAQLESDMKYV